MMDGKARTTDRIGAGLRRAALAVSALSIGLAAHAAPKQRTDAAAAAADGPVVAVTGGSVQGRRIAGGAVFKGIPYARPPVGPLRWHEPQPVVPWTGVHQAAAYASRCMQTDVAGSLSVPIRGSEDCLYLNVWSPELPARTKRPVMVWIHGGGNFVGSAVGSGSIEPPFDGASLARRGVVVVTIDYRLGVLGFVGHPALSAESPHHASGAYGLLDQLAALRWVRDNIARFGGDSANVTLFAQSAGSRDVTALVTSPLGRGLFHKAIAESGTPLGNEKRVQTPAETERLGVVLAQVLDAPATGTLFYLRGLPPERILAAVPEMKRRLAAEGLAVDVGMDGHVLPRFPAEVYRAHAEARIPMIVGNNAQDNPSHRPFKGDPAGLAEVVRGQIHAIYGRYPDLERRALAAYAPEGAATASGPYGGLDVQVGADNEHRCGTSLFADWHATVAPTWRYEFTAGTLAHPPIHTSELDYVFGYLRDQAADPTLARLSEQMQAYWTNFAKSGDPNGPGLPRWPRYDAATRPYLDLGNAGPQAGANLRGATCAIYAEKVGRDLAAR